MLKSSLVLKSHLRVQLWVLPRWFALPVAIAAVILGGVVSGASPFELAVSSGIAGLLMAFAHTMNSILDYHVTGFDKGGEDERSLPKPYTAGQNLIANGYKTRYIVSNAGVWLVLALALTAFAVAEWGSIVWMPVLLSLPLTVAYSLGKKYFLCETVLGLGFGPFAAMLGSAISPNPNMVEAFLVGIPIGIIFGFGAEAYDQWYDAEANWDRGLRNIGALAWRHDKSIGAIVLFFTSLGLFAQITLILFELLHPLSLLSIAAVLPLMTLLRPMEKRIKWSILATMVVMFLSCALMIVGHLIGGAF